MTPWLLIVVALVVIVAAFGVSWFRAGRLKSRIADGAHVAPGRGGPKDKAIAKDTGQAYQYDLGTGGGTGGLGGPSSF